MRIWSVVLSGVLAIVVASCGGQLGQLPGAAQLRDELRIALADIGTEVLDPLKGPNNNGGYLRLMFDSLVGVDAAGTELSKETGIAQDWTVSDDSKTYTFTLRSGVKFQNGDDVTAEDVKFTLTRLADPDNATSTGRAVSANTSAVTVVDPRTVRVELKSPDINLLYKLSPIIDITGLVVSKRHFDAVGAAGFAEQPMGSGPYKLVRRQTGSFMEFEQAASSHWLIGAPRFKKVTIRKVAEESSRVAMLLAGDADFINVTIGKAKDITDGGKTLIRDRKDGLLNIWFNLQDPKAPARDINVRKALSLAIDRDGLNKAFWAGQGSPTGNEYMNQLYSETLPPGEYDVARAKAALSQTAYGPGGQKLTMEIQAPARADVPHLQQVAEAVQSYWQEIGVSSTIVTGDYGAFRTKQAAKQNAPNSLLLMNRFGNREASGEAVFWQSCKGLMAMTCDPELDTLIANWVGAPSQQAYARAAVAAEKYIVGNYYNIPLLRIPLLYAGNEQVPSGYSPGTMLSSFNVLGLVWNASK